jgi:hypothetical protein
MKVFTVTVMKCKNESHCLKIQESLRGSFSFRYGYGPREVVLGDDTTYPFQNFTMMVKADSDASIRSVIAPVLGKAKAVIGEMSFLSGDKLSSEPWEWMRFEPPTNAKLTIPPRHS